jgi:hypothetical protein
MSARLERSLVDKLVNGRVLSKRKLGNPLKYNVRPAGMFSR